MGGKPARRLIHMYPAAESEAKVVYKEPLFIDEHSFFYLVFEKHR